MGLRILIYSCLQSLEYCPTEVSNPEVMDICTLQFETSIEGLELLCEEPMDGGGDFIDGSNRATTDLI